MNDTEPKWWLDSGTVQKALITLLPSIAIALKIFGVDFPETAQSAVLVLVLLGITTYASIKIIIDRFKTGNKRIVPLAKTLFPPKK